MKHNHRKSNGLRAALIFIIVVIISGVALVASGNLDNPFQVISQLTGSTGGGSERSMSASAPPMQMGERGSQSDGFNWNALGGVLSHLWFLMAASAVVMVIGRPIGLAIKRLQRLTTRPAAA